MEWKLSSGLKAVMVNAEIVDSRDAAKGTIDAGCRCEDDRNLPDRLKPDSTVDLSQYSYCIDCGTNDGH